MSDYSYVPGPWLLGAPSQGHREIWAEARAQMTDAHWKALERIADPFQVVDERYYLTEITSTLVYAGYAGLGGGMPPYRTYYMTDRGYAALFERRTGRTYLSYCIEKKWVKEGSENATEINWLMNG